MPRPKGSRNRNTLDRIRNAIIQLRPMKALDIMNAIRSDTLWEVVVQLSIEERDPATLLKVLMYLDDKAFGKANEHMSIEVKHHHDIESLERARVIAREILAYNPPVIISADDDTLK